MLRLEAAAEERQLERKRSLRLWKDVLPADRQAGIASAGSAGLGVGHVGKDEGGHGDQQERVEDAHFPRALSIAASSLASFNPWTVATFFPAPS